jgi:hypothetical protein
VAPEPLKLYMDEHVPRAVTWGLRSRGVDALTAQDAGMVSAEDEEHLLLAWRERRAIVTQDADFLRFNSTGRPHAGIIYAPQQTPIGTMVRAIMLICEVLGPEEMANHVEFV